MDKVQIIMALDARERLLAERAALFAAHGENVEHIKEELAQVQRIAKEIRATIG